MWSQEFKPHLYDDDMVFSLFTCVLNFAKGWGQEYSLTKNAAESAERWLGLGLLQPNMENWFSLFTRNPNLYARSEASTSILITLDPDIKVFKRQIYTILDLAGDIGGLFDALRVLGSVFVACYLQMRGETIAKYLLETVFKRESKSQKNKDVDKESDYYLFRKMRSR